MGTKERKQRVSELSVNIAVLLTDLELPIAELALRLGVSEDKAKSYISGKHNFTLTDISRVEDVIGYDIMNVTASLKSMKPESVVQYGYDEFVKDIDKAMKKAQTIFDNAPKVDLWQGSRNSDIIARFEGVKMMLKGLKKK